MANTVEEKNYLSTPNFEAKNNVDVKIRSYPIKGPLRVKQPEELMIRPEPVDQEPFYPVFTDYPVNSDYPVNLDYPVDPTANFGPRVTAQQLTRALENLQTIRNERRSVSRSISGSEESCVQMDSESEVRSPRVNVGTRLIKLANKNNFLTIFYFRNICSLN